jgi:uncharacterized protein YbcI
MTGSRQLSGDQLAAIAREMSRLKSDLYGKGPTASKAYQNDDIVFCVLRGGLTQVEQALVKSNDESLVRQVRLRFQEHMRPSFEGAVERITGRRVLTYNSQILFDPDMVIEVFVLDSGAPEQD